VRVNGFLLAHGFDPGPTQHPIQAGLAAGTLATVPALLLLHGFGALAVEARILALPVLATLALGIAAMAAAGAAYGALFRRGANDRRGGWLFGMAYGFLLWTGGAVMILPALGGGAAPGGKAAVGIFLALVLWGAATGAIFPFVHRRLRLATRHWSEAGRRHCGPSAAAEDQPEREVPRRRA
jgi:hypothetical protein